MTILLILADSVGFRWTLAMVLVTGFIGAWLIRRQGLIALRAIRADISRGQVPAAPMMDGVFIMMAGALLLTPGLITDALGMALLVPVTRNWIRSGVVRWFKARWQLQVKTTGSGAGPGSQVVDSYVVTHEKEGSE